MDKTFYTVDEVAFKLNISTKTVRRYVCNNKLEGVKVGGQWRIEVEAYNKFIGNNKCCSSDAENISKDDFCVFMDTDYFNSGDKIQVCSIVDYYIDDNLQVKEITNTIMDIINGCDNEDKNEMRFNYVFDKEKKKARFVFWGSPSLLGELLIKLKKFE